MQCYQYVKIHTKCKVTKCKDTKCKAKQFQEKLINTSSVVKKLKTARATELWEGSLKLNVQTYRTIKIILVRPKIDF